MTGFRAEMVGRLTVIGKRRGGGFTWPSGKKNYSLYLERPGLKGESVFLKRRNSKIGKEAPLVWYGVLYLLYMVISLLDGTILPFPYFTLRNEVQKFPLCNFNLMVRHF